MTNYTGPGAIPADHEAAMEAARRRILADYSRERADLMGPLTTGEAECMAAAEANGPGFVAVMAEVIRRERVK